MIAEILILLTSLPIGYLLAYLTREELVASRKYHLALVILCLISAIIFFILKFKEIGLTLVYIILATLISVIKSYDKKFVK